MKKALKSTPIIVLISVAIFGLCLLSIKQIIFKTAPPPHCPSDSLQSRIDSLELMLAEYMTDEVLNIVTRWEYERKKQWISESKKDSVTQLKIK